MRGFTVINETLNHTIPHFANKYNYLLMANSTKVYKSQHKLRMLRLKKHDFLFFFTDLICFNVSASNLCNFDAYLSGTHVLGVREMVHVKEGETSAEVLSLTVLGKEQRNTGSPQYTF